MKKYLIAAWAVLETFCLGGIVFGWASLVLVLKKDDIYGDLCEEEEEYNSSNITHHELNNTIFSKRTCREQDQKFGLSFIVATSLTYLSATVMGHIQYKFGTRVTRIISLCFLLCGSLLIAFLDTSTAYLIYIGLPCLAIGGMQIYITNIQVANLFVIGGSTVVGILSGMMDASGIVQFIVKIAYENGVSRKISYLFVSALQVMILVSTFLWLPKTIFPKFKIQKMNCEIDVDCAKASKEMGTKDKKVSYPALTEGLPRPFDCFTSGIFLSNIAWFCVLQLRYLYFISSLNTWLNDLTGAVDEQVNHFTNVGLYIQLAAIGLSPLAGFLLDVEKSRHGGRRTITERRLQPCVIPQMVTSFLGVLISILVLIPNTQVLYVDFIVIALFRSFLYAIAANVVHMLFPMEYYGFLLGAELAIGGLIGALQYPLFLWTENSPAGADKVNIFLLVLTSVSFLHPLYIWITCRAAEKKALKTPGTEEETEYALIKKRSVCFKNKFSKGI